jgi:hypothetical protein
MDAYVPPGAGGLSSPNSTPLREKIMAPALTSRRSGVLPPLEGISGGRQQLPGCTSSQGCGGNPEGVKRTPSTSLAGALKFMMIVP